MTKMLGSSFWDYIDAYIIVKENIKCTEEGTDSGVIRADERDKQAIFKKVHRLLQTGSK